MMMVPFVHFALEIIAGELCIITYWQDNSAEDPFSIPNLGLKIIGSELCMVICCL